MFAFRIYSRFKSEEIKRYFQENPGRMVIKESKLRIKSEKKMIFFSENQHQMHGFIHDQE